MSTTVTYKGSTLTTVNNNTKTLKTAGKYMEGDVVITDVTRGGFVTQDQDGFIILPPDGGGSPSVGGLEYETGTWTPASDTISHFIQFNNTHTELPMYFMIVDADDTYDTTLNTNYMVIYSYWGTQNGGWITPNNQAFWYGRCYTLRRTTNETAFGIGTHTITKPASDSSDIDASEPRYWVTENGIKAFINSTTYWRAGRTYKWIAVWAPTT